MIQLRPYQREAVDAVHAAAEDEIRRPAIGLPTGTGKTIVFSKLIEERGHPALILAHRDELIQQAIDKYNDVDGTVPVGIVKAGLNQSGLPVVAASVQTLARRARLEQMPKDFKTIVIDEAHHASADSYRRIVDYFSDNCELIVGVSATLRRSDRVALGRSKGGVFEKIVYHKTILDMIRAGYLVDIRALRVKVRGANFGSLRVVRGDFVDSEIGEMLSESGAPAVAVNAYLEHAAGRKTIVFTPTVALAVEMAEEFLAAGIPAAPVSGTTAIEERRARLRAFKTGELQVITNAMVLTEGYDEPSVSCIIVARPTKSSPFYTQMIGRGTRLFPGKEDLIVLDLVGNDERVDLMSVPTLFGLDPSKVAKDGVGGAQAAKERTLEFRARQSAGLEIVAEEADLFKRKDVNWLRLNDGRWMLGLGDMGTLFLEPGAKRDTWRAVKRFDKGTAKEAIDWKTNPQGKPVLLADDLDLAFAMGVAEEHLRRVPKARFVALRTAPWREGPPSQKQIEALQKWRVPIPEKITKGEASDLLSAVIASNR